MKRPSLWHQLLDLIAPRLCAICERRLTLSEQVLCVPCNLHLPRTGYQFNAYDNPMARLFWGIIPVERVAALMFYASHAQSSQLVYDLKYHDRPDIGLMMGRIIGQEFSEAGFFDGIDLIVPIPLAKSRQRHRGYNQSEELARGIGLVIGLPVSNRVVRRTVFEKSQTKIGRQERRENVDNVFEIVDASAIRHRHVLLVDDVVTTGATMIACGRELLRVEGVRLSLLSLGFTKS